MIEPYFQSRYLDWILIQQKEGTVCATCRKTEVEHVFEPNKTCRNPDYTVAGGGKENCGKF